MDNITSFIVAATERSLKVDQAQNDLDAAKSAVEAARAAVEAAKADVEAAKVALAAAKEVYEQIADQSDSFNLSKGKFKDAVERMKGILADIGAIDVPASPAPAADAGEPKARTPRKRKAEAEPSEDAAAARTSDEATVQTVDAAPSAQDDAADALSSDETPASGAAEEFIELEFAAPGVGYTLTVPAESLVAAGTEASPEVAVVAEGAAEAAEPTAESASDEVAGEASVSTATPSAAAASEIDNSAVVEDLRYMIDDNANGPSELREILHAALKVAAWYNSAVEPKEMTVVPSPITVAAVWAAVEGQYVPKDVAAAAKNALVHGEETAVRAIEWFAKLARLLEEGRDGEIEPFVLNAAGHAQPAVDEAPLETAAIEQVADDVEIAAPDTQAPALETIEEMSLFEGSDVADEVPAVEIPPAPVPHPAPEPEAKPAPAAAPIKTGRPSWMNNK